MNSDIIYIFRWGDRQEQSGREIKIERKREREERTKRKEKNDKR